MRTMDLLDISVGFRETVLGTQSRRDAEKNKTRLTWIYRINRIGRHQEINGI